MLKDSTVTVDGTAPECGMSTVCRDLGARTTSDHGHVTAGGTWNACALDRLETARLKRYPSTVGCDADHDGKELPMRTLADATAVRTPDRPIDPIFLRRWSPRAMTGAGVSAEDLATVFEAARWAPSTYNEQEWRFLYAHRGGPHWQSFFDLLAEGNRAWCDRAGVLVVVLSHTVFARNGKPNPVHSFDTGAAFENLALQGCRMGLVVHGMMGFDNERARTSLAVPEEYAVEAMIAIGHPGDPGELPDPLRALEAPSQRKPVAELAREGKFSF